LVVVVSFEGAMVIGEWLGDFFKNIGICTAYCAELWRILEGLKQARRLNFNKVELCVESLIVVRHINSMRVVVLWDVIL
jgi:ribonuclease HI